MTFTHTQRLLHPPPLYKINALLLYITNIIKQQNITTNNYRATTAPVTRVPQGSVLGPFTGAQLFLNSADLNFSSIILHGSSSASSPPSSSILTPQPRNLRSGDAGPLLAHPRIIHQGQAGFKEGQILQLGRPSALELSPQTD